MASAADRPGGLTVLAVLNFVFAALGALATIGFVFMVFRGQVDGQMVVQIILHFLGTGLLAVSGIGYLQRSRLLGWGGGNAYVVVSIVANVFAIYHGETFSFGHLFGFILPLFNLVLINTTFRIDLGGRPRKAPATSPDWVGGTRPNRGGGVSARHISLVCRYASRFAMRTGGGLVFQFLLLAVGIGVVAIILVPLENLANTLEDEGRALRLAETFAKSERVTELVDSLIGDEETTRHLIHERPALVSATMVFLYGFLPFFVCAGAFNQFAGDIGSRGLRYLLLRTDRANVFFGRFLGTALFTLAGMALLFTTIAVFIQFRFSAYPASELWNWTGICFLGAVLFSLPHIAIGSLISASIRSPFGALALCYAAVGGPLLMFMSADAAIPGGVDWLTKLVPWGWRFHALSPDFGRLALGVAVLLAYTAGLLFIGLRVFSRRDL